jgi:hypothetical protein
MTLEDILPDLLKLDRADKLRAIELLAHEVAVEEIPRLTHGKEYAVWSPYDSATTARQMQELLEESRRSGNG